MFINNQHKGLAIFRAAKAERKEIAILAKEVANSNPDKTEAECRVLAAEIKAARERTAEAEAQRQKQHHARKGQSHQKVQRHQNRKPRKGPEVIVVNKVAK